MRIWDTARANYLSQVRHFFLHIFKRDQSLADGRELFVALRVKIVEQFGARAGCRIGVHGSRARDSARRNSAV